MSSQRSGDMHGGRFPSAPTQVSVSQVRELVASVGRSERRSEFKKKFADAWPQIQAGITELGLTHPEASDLLNEWLGGSYVEDVKGPLIVAQRDGGRIKDVASGLQYVVEAVENVSLIDLEIGLRRIAEIE